MKWQLIVLNLFELAACVTGFLYWNKVKSTHWRWFPIYLGVIVLTELTAEYFLHVRHNLKVNIAIYKYFGVPFEFLFFFWLFHMYFNRNNKNKWPLYSAATYLVFWMLDIVYMDKKELYFENISYIVGCLLLLVLLLMFFIDFSKSDEILTYRSSMMFWVCLGLIIFYIGSLPFYGLRRTLWEISREFFYVYWYIQFGLNYLMYILFSVSFIWGRPR